MWGKATAIRAVLRAPLEGQRGSPQHPCSMGTGCGERPWGQRGAVGQRATEVLCKPFCRDCIGNATTVKDLHGEEVSVVQTSPEGTATVGCPRW